MGDAYTGVALLAESFFSPSGADARWKALHENLKTVANQRPLRCKAQPHGWPESRKLGAADARLLTVGICLESWQMKDDGKKTWRYDDHQSELCHGEKGTWVLVGWWTAMLAFWQVKVDLPQANDCLVGGDAALVTEA
jgi:hypothetical protein